MIIQGLEKMSLVDYDGFVSATVFTGGCNFRCPFCHNSSLVLDSANLPVLSVEEVLSYLKKRKGLLDGVCVSGGEPTLNKDLPDFIRNLKDIGYSVKLDTNGTNPDMIKLLFEQNLIDYVAMDIKNSQSDYAEIIGFSNYNLQNVIKSVDFLMNSGINYEFRTTLIKEFHSKQNIIDISKWIKGANKYFLQKFKDTGSCIKSNLSPIDKDTAIDFQNVLTQTIPNTFLRGYD